MPDRMLTALVELTRHRDQEALEIAFATAVQDLLSARHVCIYEIEADGAQLEESVRLDVPAGSQAHEMQWGNERRRVEVWPEAAECLSSGLPRLDRGADGPDRMLLPVRGENRIARLVVIESEAGLQARFGPIEDFTRVFGNYLRVLDEGERDRLTGLLDRRAFESKLERLLRRQSRRTNGRGNGFRTSSWMALVDVDHFKRLNDQYGHVYADEILLRLAQFMASFFDPEDLLFRVGGEEFVVVLAPTDQATAAQAFEAFRQAVADKRFPSDERLTISIGYARVKRGEFPRRIFDLADRALYFAKQAGPNQVRCHEALVAQGLLREKEASGSVELF